MFFIIGNVDRSFNNKFCWNYSREYATNDDLCFCFSGKSYCSKKKVFDKNPEDKLIHIMCMLKWFLFFRFPNGFFCSRFLKEIKIITKHQRSLTHTHTPGYRNKSIFLFNDIYQHVMQSNQSINRSKSKDDTKFKQIN